MAEETQQVQHFIVHRVQGDLYFQPVEHEEGKRISSLQKLLKADGIAQTNARSRQGLITGRQYHPFDFDFVTQFDTSNEHHSTCLRTKTASTVGLGFVLNENEQLKITGQGVETPQWRYEESVVDTTLDPLCDHSFADVLYDAGEEFWRVGNGYIEVVRWGKGKTKRKQKQITGLHHLSSPQTYIFLEDISGNRHFEIVSNEDVSVPGDRRFARFGELEEFKGRIIARKNYLDGVPGVNNPVIGEVPDDEFEQALVDGIDDVVSEVIHFRNPTSLHRWYGYADWLAATASIELTQCLHQQRYDYYLNRGVPEFLLIIYGGQKIEPDLWSKIEKAVEANIGLGNSHKTMAINIPGNSDLKVELHKLAMEGSNAGQEFGDTKENLALGIVSAHRVPPLLAGIQIPGKLGATNELPNALMAFQTLVVGQAQRVIQQTLARTLGNPELNGGLNLQPKDFRFRTITEAIDVNRADTMSRMRQTLPEAEAEGRDLDAGLRD